MGGAYSKGSAYWKEGAKSNHYGTLWPLTSNPFHLVEVKITSGGSPRFTSTLVRSLTYSLSSGCYNTLAYGLARALLSGSNPSCQSAVKSVKM